MHPQGWIITLHIGLDYNPPSTVLDYEPAPTGLEYGDGIKKISSTRGHSLYGDPESDGIKTQTTGPTTVLTIAHILTAGVCMCVCMCGLLQRHQLVNSILKHELQHGLHALSIVVSRNH